MGSKGGPLATPLLRRKEGDAGNHPAGITNATYEKAKAAIGEQGIFEVAIVVGNYQTVSYILCGFRIQVPEGEADPVPTETAKFGVGLPRGSAFEGPSRLAPIMPDTLADAKKKKLFQNLSKAMGTEKGALTGPWNACLLSTSLGTAVFRQGGTFFGKQFSIRPVQEVCNSSTF